MGQAAETLEPRIYVACLAAYNSGWLQGAWIDVGDDADAVWAAIAAMLKTSPVARAEEWAIHDYEGFGGVEIAGFLRERGVLGALVLEHVGGDVEAARTTLDEQYHGVFESLADCFQALTEETTVIPGALRNYIDWQAMGRDAQLSGDVFTLETAHDAVHVFWAR